MDDKWFKHQQKIVGVTAEEIAAQMGRDRSVVSKILSGKQQMSLPWARAFSEVLQVPLSVVLEKAGVGAGDHEAEFQPGVRDADAVLIVFRPGDPMEGYARIFGAFRPGFDVLRVQSDAMSLEGILVGDYIVVDTTLTERCGPGDVVIAQADVRGTSRILLRRYEPPVLVMAGGPVADRRVHVVDGVNVVIKGKVVALWRV